MTDKKPPGRPRKDREHGDKDDAVRALLLFVAHVLKKYELTYTMLAPAVARKTGKTKQAAGKMVGRQLGGTQKKKIEWWILELLFDHVPGDERPRVREEGRRLYVEAYPDDTATASVREEIVLGKTTLEGGEHLEAVPSTVVHEMVQQVSDFLATAATAATVDTATTLQTRPIMLEPAPHPDAAPPAGRTPDLETLKNDLQKLWLQVKQRQCQRQDALERLLQAQAERREVIQRHRTHIHKLLRAAHVHRHRLHPGTEATPTQDRPGSDFEDALAYPARWLLPLDPPLALPSPLDLPAHKDQQMVVRLQRVIAELQRHAQRLWDEYDEAVRQHAKEVALRLESEHHFAEYLNDLTVALRSHHTRQDMPARRTPMRRILGPASEQTHSPPWTTPEHRAIERK